MKKKQLMVIVSLFLFSIFAASIFYICTHRRLSVEVNYVYPDGREEIFDCWDWVTIYRIDDINDLRYIQDVKELYKKGNIDYIGVMEQIRDLSLQDEKKIKLAESGKINFGISRGDKLIVLINKGYCWFEVVNINENNKVIRFNNENVIE